MRTYQYKIHEYSDRESEYRQFLGDRIESETGVLNDENNFKGIFSLSTSSLEKLYSSLFHSSPSDDFGGHDSEPEMIDAEYRRSKEQFIKDNPNSRIARER